MNDESLLDAILSETEATPKATEVTPTTPRGRIVKDTAEIEYEIINEETGEARRITPLPSRSAARKPAELVRFFPPLVSTAQRDWKALFASIAADPLKAQKLVTLIASTAPDGRSALYTLGTQWKLTDAEADLIVSAYLELKKELR